MGDSTDPCGAPMLVSIRPDSNAPSFVFVVTYCFLLVKKLMNYKQCVYPHQQQQPPFEPLKFSDCTQSKV